MMKTTCAPILTVVLAVACRTTTGSAGSSPVDQDSLRRVEVPESLKDTPLEEEAKACAATYRTSMKSAKTAEVSTALLTVTTAVGAAVAALATGMSATVKSEAAKQNWAYVGLGAAASIPLTAGLNLWVNAGENAREERAAAWHQATRLFNAGYLMSCTNTTAWQKRQAQKALSLALKDKDKKDYVGLLKSGEDWAKGTTKTEAFARDLRAAVAKADPVTAQKLQEVADAAKKVEEEPPPQAAFCRDDKGSMKSSEQLRDEAHKELAQCLAPAIWAYGPLPAAQASGTPGTTGGTPSR